ncbi:MAG: hypothetical protein FJ090_20235 [Deltaproteobacteria bacterium]|nr:hypothetical protein [Deltaproteobacteria bacterium]
MLSRLKQLWAAWNSRQLGAKLKQLSADYGVLALGVWFGVFGLTFVTVAALVHMGVDWPWLAEKTGGMGTLVAAYAVTKLLTPVRLAVVVAVLPWAARVRDRVRLRT